MGRLAGGRLNLGRVARVARFEFGGYDDALGFGRVFDADLNLIWVDAARYRANPRLIGFFVGKVMKATQGKADPQLVNRLLKEALDAATPPE